MEAIVGLLACSGMRVGEALALDRADVDFSSGLITIRRAKLDKERLVPLHESALDALGMYGDERDRLSPRPTEPAFFVSAAGTRMLYCNFHHGYQQMVRRAGITARSASCRPRPHDLRHRFAVDTLTDWYRDGADVTSRLPVLSRYLGHVDPAATYWYLSGSLELLSLAARRLERSYETER
jgi:integrase